MLTNSDNQNKNKIYYIGLFFLIDMESFSKGLKQALIQKLK